MKRFERCRFLISLVLLSTAISMIPAGWPGKTAGAQSDQVPNPKVRGDSKSDGDSETDSTNLTRLATDLTALARHSIAEPANLYESEIRRITRVLLRAEKNNPLLIREEPSSGELIINALAQRMVSGDVPEPLQNKRLLKLDLGRLFTDGTNTEHELNAILVEAEKTKDQLILFIDEIPELLGTESVAGAASNMLKRALLRGSLHCISATTASGYKAYIKRDAALARLFSAIHVNNQDSESSEESRSLANQIANEWSPGNRISADLIELTQNADPETGGVSLILQAENMSSDTLEAILSRSGGRVKKTLKRLGALEIELPVSAVEELAASNQVSYLSLNREVRSLGHIETTTGALAMRQQSGNSGLDGTGIGIAVLDSSIFDSHESFEAKNTSDDRVTVSVDFTGQGMNTEDPYGHGTHVASLAAGSRKVASGAYTGIAPNANLINLRVLNSAGVGTVFGVLQALDWVMLNRTRYNIRVVNLSIGMPAIDSYRNDPLCRAVRRLVDAGIVVVAAAGNNGINSFGQKVYGLIHSPGNEPSAITVGATNTYGTDTRSDDGIATYSSRGPTRSYWTDSNAVKHYDNFIKPDVVAPGNKLIAAQSKRNWIVSNHPQLSTSSGNSGSDDIRMMRLSGTSMAAPIVAGTAALMFQANPSLKPNLVKMILMYTAQPLAGFNHLEQGAGEINIEGAVRLAKLVRRDLTNSTPLGAPLLTTNMSPEPRSTIAGQTISWSEGIIPVTAMLLARTSSPSTRGFITSVFCLATASW